MLKFLIQSYDKIFRQALHIKNRYYQDYSFSCNNESGCFYVDCIKGALWNFDLSTEQKNIGRSCWLKGYWMTLIKHRAVYTSLKPTKE